MTYISLSTRKMIRCVSCVSGIRILIKFKKNLLSVKFSVHLFTYLLSTIDFLKGQFYAVSQKLKFHNQYLIWHKQFLNNLLRTKIKFFLFFLLDFGLSRLTSLQLIQYHVTGFYKPTIPQSPPSHLRDYSTCNNARLEFVHNSCSKL